MTPRGAYVNRIKFAKRIPAIGKRGLIQNFWKTDEMSFSDINCQLSEREESFRTFEENR